VTNAISDDGKCPLCALQLGTSLCARRSERHRQTRWVSTD